MTDGAHAVGLLIAEAWAAMRQSRYAKAAAAAGRAVTAAEETGDVVLLVRALSVRAETLRVPGDHDAALVDYTRILALAEDPATAGRLGGDGAAWAIANAYGGWVESARFRGRMAIRELFAVLDAGERWMRATGRPHWRAGLLAQRAELHGWLGETETAIAFAEEALASHRSDAPGLTPGSYRFILGDLLSEHDRHGEAVPYYQAILDDPASNPHERMTADIGLTHCAVAGQDSIAAHRYAAAAMQLAGELGDKDICDALAARVAACRASGDLDAALEAATRRREVAGRVAGYYRPYRAVRDAADVALDRADEDGARALLADLDRHATALDADIATTRFTDEAAQRHDRLARLRSADD